MTAFTSPSEARDIAIREFTRVYRPTCSCRPGTIELRAESAAMVCAKCDRVIVVRRRAR
jgi:hypothetical protein